MMSDPELIQVALRLREDGNAKFRLGEFKAAEGHYKDAAAHLETVKNDNKDLRDLKVTLLQNISVVTNKTGDFKETIRCCSKALKIDEKAIKALFLRSVAHLKTHNYEDALTDCKAAIILNPKEKSYRDHWELIKTEKASKSQSQQAAM